MGDAVVIRNSDDRTAAIKGHRMSRCQDTDRPKGFRHKKTEWMYTNIRNWMSRIGLQILDFRLDQVGLLKKKTPLFAKRKKGQWPNRIDAYRLGAGVRSKDLLHVLFAVPKGFVPLIVFGNCEKPGENSLKKNGGKGKGKGKAEETERISVVRSVIRCSLIDKKNQTENCLKKCIINQKWKPTLILLIFKGGNY